MSFMSPLMLLSLLLVPLLVAAYLLLMNRRAAETAGFGAMRLAGSRSGRSIGPRKHIPPAIFLVAIALLLASLGRPSMVIALPHQEGTVILAFDVSNSMLADDLSPSRMEAAKVAARAFVEKQPSSILIGVVAFSDGALIVQQPTNLQADVLAAIDRLSPQGGTSLGEGIFTSLRAAAGKPIELDQAALEGDLEGVDIGYFGSTVLIILSDGENTSRADPLIMAALASNAGVRVYPIGIGSPEGTTLEIEGFVVATSLNEPLLQEIADVTGGDYFRAEDEAALTEVYGSIDLKLATKREETEVTSVVAGLALLLLFAGGGLTMLWFGRVP